MTGLASDSSSAAENSADPSAASGRDTEFGIATTQPVNYAAADANIAAELLPSIRHIGRYALKYQIGEGGLGVVYAAHDPLLSRLIAIKTLNLTFVAEERESFTSLFLNEARAAGSLSHPHIVTVFDAGVSEQGAYIAMELLKGRDLRQLRLEGWKPTHSQAALIVRRVADALAYAHSKGVVHLDVKPANIFMVGRTQPRVLDFGIARIAHRRDSQTNIAAGSPYYMAPEQIRREPVDRRCDVYSLGVVLYELLTLIRPFDGLSLSEITESVLEGDALPAHQIDPSVPVELSNIAARAMEKNPNDRYRSARALHRDLSVWLQAYSQDSDPGADALPPQMGRPLAWTLISLAGLTLAAGAWWSMTRHRAQSAPTSIATAPAVSASPLAAPAAASAVVAPAPIPSGGFVLATPTSAVPPVSAEAAASAGISTPVGAELPASGPTITANADPAGRAPVTKLPLNATEKPHTLEQGVREARIFESSINALPAPAPGSTNGVLRLAVSPWAHIEIDGKSVGTAPPLHELTLNEGRHMITLRNNDFPPYHSTVMITADQPVNLKHRFGS